jgi:hypothetical protein
MHKKQQEHLRPRFRQMKELGVLSSPFNIHENRTRSFATYVSTIGLLLVLGDIALQQSTYPVGNSYGVYLGYVAVPLFIFSVFTVVYTHSYSALKIAWKNKGTKLLSISSGILYAGFYIFVTNMVSVPDLPMPPRLQGFILPFQVYDHLAVWPDVEFWSPQLNLVGYFSVGSVLIVSSLGALTAFSVALLTHNIRIRSGKERPIAFVGSFLTSLSTNACCCCAPVILPAVLTMFGLGASSPIAEDVTFQTMPIFNLLWIATVMLLLLSIILSTKREASCKE